MYIIVYQVNYDKQRKQFILLTFSFVLTFRCEPEMRVDKMKPVKHIII